MFPWLPDASSSGVVVFPPVMSLPVGWSSKYPTWFVVLVTVTVIGTLAPESIVFEVDFGRPVRGDGCELVVGERPGDGLGELRPVGRRALHDVDLPQARLGVVAMSDAFPVWLLAVGVASVEETSMFPDLVMAGRRSDGENR